MQTYHGCDTEVPTMAEIEDPLYIWFTIFPISFWIEAALQTDLYAQEVIAKVRMTGLQGDRQVEPRPWTPIGKDWDRVINFIGIYTYVSAARPGAQDFNVFWSKSGYDGNSGTEASVHDPVLRRKSAVLRRRRG